MNGGEGGISTLDRVFIVTFGVGCLLLHLGRHLWRT